MTDPQRVNARGIVSPVKVVRRSCVGNGQSGSGDTAGLRYFRSRPTAGSSGGIVHWLSEAAPRITEVLNRYDATADWGRPLGAARSEPSSLPLRNPLLHAASGGE